MPEQLLKTITRINPKNYRELELGSVAAITTGCLYPRYEWPQEQLQPVTTIEKIIDDTIILSGPEYIRVSEREKSKFILKKGDILFRHSATSLQLGKSVLFDLNQPVLHTKYLRIRPNADCNSHFLLLILNLLRSKGKLHFIAHERKNLSVILVDDIKKLRIPVPSIEDQIRIAMDHESEVSFD